MAALGDSLSEAVLANFAFEAGISDRELFRMLNFASIADPTERIQAFRAHYAAYGKSWSSGYDTHSLVYSHAQRLKEVVPELLVENFAVAGSEARHLSTQVDALLHYENENELLFDYFTLLIGANDLKGNTLGDVPSALEFVGTIETQLRRLIESRPSAWILLSGLPDVFKIFDSTAHLVVRKILGRSVTCDQVRRGIYGNSVLFETSNQFVRQAIETLFDDYHSGLSALADRLNEEYPHIKVKFVSSFASAQKPAKAISVDCFHPSEWGQAEIAEITWQAGFWSDLKPSLPVFGLLTAKN